MKTLILILTGIFAIASTVVHAQCPTIGDLLDGGTFNPGMDCNYGSVGSVTFTGNVTYTGNLTFSNVNVATISSNFTWISGTFTITGTGPATQGHLVVSGTGTLSVQAGTLTIADGQLDVNANGSATISAGATVTTGNTGDNDISGVLTIDGNATFGGDVVVAGSSAYVIMNSGSVMDINRSGGDGDLEVTGGGHFTMNGGTLSVQDDITTEVNGSPIAGSTGNFIIDGSVTVGDDIILTGTSSLTSSSEGAGSLTIGDDFTTDASCPYTAGVTVAFCHCRGTNRNNSMCSSALPIEILTFSGNQKGNVVNLFWETATEKNNHFFTIERLLDNDSFESILNVEGSGTTMMPVKYEAHDTHPRDGRNYYRLRQTDYDGATTTSELIMVEFERKEISYSVYPNPTRDSKFRVEINGLEAQQHVSIILKTLQGAGVFAFDQSADMSGYIYRDMEAPTKGLYLLYVAGKPIKLIVE